MPLPLARWRRAEALLLAGLSVAHLPSHAEAPDPATITVTAQKAQVAKKIDKTVYDVSNMPRAANGSAQDVLQSTPEVSVSADGRIAVKGNANVTVLIDGKPSAMLSGAEQAVALQTMSGADIASVEVITNPSAAYQANGGAILNIVMKRQRKPGTHGQLQGSVADQGLWNIGGSGDLSRKDLSLYGSLSSRHDGTLKYRQSEVAWHPPQGGPSVQTAQTSEVFVRRLVNSAALGLDLALNDTDGLSLSGRYNTRHSRPRLDVLNLIRSGATDTVFHRISEGPNEQADHSATLSYSHQERGTATRAMLQHSATTGLIDKSYSDVFFAPERATDYSHGATRTTRRLAQATVDWTRSDQQGQWGLGIDLQRKSDGIDNFQAAVDPLTGAETPAPDTTNRYDVQTRTSAGYLTYLIKRGQWEVLLGGRAERYTLDLRSLLQPIPTAHWQAFNPSLHLRYALSENLDLTLSYRRSLQMPDPRDLNPFRTYIDAQNVSRGNPALQPQRLQSWELGSNADAGPVSGSLALFYRASTATVTDAHSVECGNVLLTSKENGGQAHSQGITGALDWKLNAKLQLGADLGAYRVKLDTPDLTGPVRQAGNAGYLNLRAAYSSEGNELSLDAHGQTSGISPLGRYGATSNVNLTWKHTLSPTLSLTVNANDLFDGSKRSYATDASSYRQSGFDHFVARRLYVGLVSKFK